MIESTKGTTKPRRVIRTNTTPINNNTTKPRRVIRENLVVPVIRNNNGNSNIRPTNTTPVRSTRSRKNNDI